MGLHVKSDPLREFSELARLEDPLFTRRFAEPTAMFKIERLQNKRATRSQPVVRTKQEAAIEKVKAKDQVIRRSWRRPVRLRHIRREPAYSGGGTISASKVICSFEGIGKSVDGRYIPAAIGKEDGVSSRTARDVEGAPGREVRRDLGQEGVRLPEAIPASRQGGNFRQASRPSERVE
jgi:hypothetical protein